MRGKKGIEGGVHRGRGTTPGATGPPGTIVGGPTITATDAEVWEAEGVEEVERPSPETKELEVALVFCDPLCR